MPYHKLASQQPGTPRAQGATPRAQVFSRQKSQTGDKQAFGLDKDRHGRRASDSVGIRAVLHRRK